MKNYEKRYNMLDLFSGIGGFHHGLKMAGYAFNWVGYSDIDKYANYVYSVRFPEAYKLGDVKEIITSDLPQIDIITGGFPCVDLSICQNSTRKDLKGKQSGLFYEMVRICNEIHPDIIIIENVPRFKKYREDVNNLLQDWHLTHGILDAKDFRYCATRRKRHYTIGLYKGCGFRKIPDIEEICEPFIQSRRTQDVLPMCLPWKGGPSLERLASCIVENTENDSTRIRKSNGVSRRVGNNVLYQLLGNTVVPIVIAWLGYLIKQEIMRNS